MICPSCKSPDGIGNSMKVEEATNNPNRITTYICLNCGYEYAEEY